jgi:ribosomal protein S18 acetylase RimI-like enzyme
MAPPEGLTFRTATPADTERIAEIMFDEPGQEATGLAGGEERAREISKAMVRLPNSPQGWQQTVLAELDGEAVGVLQAGINPVSVTITPRLALTALRIFGPVDLIRLLPRLRARGRLNMKAPEDSYHVAELHVDRRVRGRGIGGTVLDYAEDEARKRGCRRMSLTTHTANPARRLYERRGFRVVETRTDTDYERYTGIEGRHLMVKELG